MRWDDAVAASVAQALSDTGRIVQGWTTRHERPEKVRLWLIEPVVPILGELDPKP